MKTPVGICVARADEAGSKPAQALFIRERWFAPPNEHDAKALFPFFCLGKVLEKKKRIRV